MCWQLDNRFNLLFLGTLYKFPLVYNCKRPLNWFVLVCVGTGATGESCYPLGLNVRQTWSQV